MKTFYLVRHGESESNAGGVIQGLEKTPLTEEGRRQAMQIADRASRLSIDILIASPALRTRQTSEIIAEKIGTKITYQDNLIEWNRGSASIGKRIADPELRERDEIIISHFDDPSFRYQDEENFSELNQRAEQALGMLSATEGEHVLVVGHGLFTRVLVGKAIFGPDLTGRDLRHLIYGFATKNTGLTVLQFDPSDHYAAWRLITWNDHAHLG